MKTRKHRISWSRLVVASVTAGLTLASPLGTGLVEDVFATTVNDADMCVNTVNEGCNDAVVYSYNGESDTYTLNDNIEFGTGKSIRITGREKTTLDLNGKTVTGAIKVMGGALTIKNGIINDNAGYGLSVFNESVVTLEDVNVTVDSGDGGDRGVYVFGGAIVNFGKGTTIKSDAYGLDVEGAEVNIDGATIKAESETNDTYGIVGWGKAAVTLNSGEIVSTNGYGISGNGNLSEQGAQFTVNGGSITASETGIYLPTYDGVSEITGGEIIGGMTAVEIRAGSLDISGGILTSTSTTDPTKSAANGNGTTTDGAALAVVEHTTNDDIHVNISGGTFKGVASVFEANPHGMETIPEITVSDGTFQGVVFAEDIEEILEGGNYDKAPEAKYIKDGLDAYQNSAKTYDILDTQEDKTGEELELATGETVELENVYGDEFADYLTYESADTNVATVKDGIVTAVASGETTVFVKLVGVKATYVASYATKVYAVIDDGEEDVELNVNGGQWYDGEIDADVRENGEWESIDANVATVNKGTITPVAAGNTDVIVKYGLQMKTYHVTVKSTFSKAELDDETVYVYNGEAKEATIKVLGASGETVSADYYDVTYEDNVNAGTATATAVVNEAGEAAGYRSGSTASTTFVIEKATSTQEVTVVGLEYNGEDQELGELTTDNDGTVEFSLDGESWGTEAPKAAEIGQYTVHYRISGGENYNDVSETTYAATIMAGPFSVELVTNDEYDQKHNIRTELEGSAILDETWTVEDESVATISNGIIYAKAKGETKISTTYNGVEVKFDVVVTEAKSAEDAGEFEISDTSALPEWQDLEVDPENGRWESENEEVAVAQGNTITMVGPGETIVWYYFGNVTRKYNVKVTEQIIAVDGEGELAFDYDYDDELEYNGESQKPELTLTAPDGTVLTNSEDYWTEIRYYADEEDYDNYEVLEGATDVKSEGSYAIYVEGTGKYTGSIRMWFRVKPVDIAEFTVVALNAEYTGEEIAPEITVTDGDGNELEQGTDFTYVINGEDETETEVDKYTITVTGQGNYIGTNVVDWEITEVEQIIENGAYTIKSAVDNSFVLDIAGGSTANEANVQVYKSNNTVAQRYLIEYAGKGYYWIENVRSGHDLGVSDTNIKDGVNVVQYDYRKIETLRDDARVLWKAEEVSDGVYIFKSALGDYYLNLSGGKAANGKNVQVYHNDNTNAMKWGLTKDETFTGEDSEAVEDRGMYEFVSKVNDSSALDVAGGTTKNGANIQLYHSNGTGAQRFKAVQLNNGYYVLVNANSLNTADEKVLDVAGGSTKNGANVQQYEWNGTPAQQWKIIDNGDGTVSLMSRANGKYLDVAGAGAKDGTNVQIYDGNGTKAQKFTVRRVEE
ncbi:MAG: RICIN domain-containing protein [Candidatus Saccharibacteria bacterium]|nr:RICIN domain-containing protein [Candidatus Saccharibacteria bacterium]